MRCSLARRPTWSASPASTPRQAIRWSSLACQIPGSTNAFVVWPLAIATSALVALVFGAIALRTSGLYFIMITLAFAQMLYFVAVSAQAYGGVDGLTLDTVPTLGPIDTGNRQQLYWVVLVALVTVLLLCRRIVEFDDSAWCCAPAASTRRACRPSASRRTAIDSPPS